MSAHDGYIAPNITDNEILKLSCSPSIDPCLPLNLEDEPNEDERKIIKYDPAVNIPLMVLLSVDRIHDFEANRSGGGKVNNVNQIVFKWLEEWYSEV